MSYYATSIKHFLIALGLLFLPTLSHAHTVQQPLSPEKAFQLNASIGDDKTIMLRWQIADNYYLYREKLSFSVEQPKGAYLGRILLPQGQPRTDSFLGKHHVYTDQVTIAVPIIGAQTKDTAELLLHYQGCSASGYCYPPMQKRFILHFATHKLTSKDAEESISAQSMASQSQAETLLQTHRFISITIGFLILGLLLSLTPCVLPMVPIISSIIVGHQKNLTPLKGFLLSLTYVLSMAATYAAAGVAAAYLGTSLQALLQMPWIIFSMALLFILLALAFFGIFRLNLPTTLTGKIAAFSRKQKGGTYISVAIMGILATLILSPCVTPALIGVLTYITQSGNPWLGGGALFLMGLGMGIPLLLIGIAGGKFLPKVGHWMGVINKIFGVLMLAVAIWLLSRILSGQMILALWAVLAIITGITMGAFNFSAKVLRARLLQGIGFTLLLYGSILLIGASMGNTNPLNPLAHPGWYQSDTTKTADDHVKTTHPTFTAANNLKELSQMLAAAAKAPSKPILVEFYADWCIACKELDANVFSKPEVIEALSHFIVLRADVTNQDTQHQALQKHFHVIAPPTMLFFDKDGQPLPKMTLIGSISAKDFMKHLRSIRQR